MALDKTTKTILAGSIIFALLLMGFAIGVLVFGCGCPKINRPNATKYTTDKNECNYTNTGVCIITNNQDVNFGKIDDKITEVENCISEWYKTRSDTLHRNYNWKKPKRSCYTVYIPSDIRISCEDPNQFVYGEVSWEACAAKGLEQKEGCKCGFRCNVQDGNIIITEPSLTNFKACLIEFLTGFRSIDIWSDEEISKCAI